MQIKEMKSYSESQKMYTAWIKTDGEWYSTCLLFNSVDHIRRHYKGMIGYSKIYDPDQTDRWENAEIIAVPVDVAIPDEAKEVQK